jgi:uncharacterized protein YbaR (Trm112 family)/ubiquinone/menaquinone biosynthesis C-methylase UbiE
MNYAAVLVCPDCRGPLDEIRQQESVGAFLCDACDTVFPVKDGIPILLSVGARNHDLEYSLLADLGRMDPHTTNAPASFGSAVTRTLALVASNKDRKSWEWENEVYWRRVYQTELCAEQDKNWDIRVWQMEWLLARLLSRTSLHSKTIIDVGCGEGQIFRSMFARHCNAASLYIATDISIDGLILNRARNTHRNALYVLCSADRLPFAKGLADLLCYFGILHHTERKAATIPEDSNIVAGDGHIIVHEALERPYLSSILTFLRPTEESAHEERVKKDQLWDMLRSATTLDVVDKKELYSPAFAFTRYLPTVAGLNHRWLYSTIGALGAAVIKTLGWMSPALSAGEVMMLVRKATPNVQAYQ